MHIQTISVNTGVVLCQMSVCYLTKTVEKCVNWFECECVHTTFTEFTLIELVLPSIKEALLVQLSVSGG